MAKAILCQSLGVAIPMVAIFFLLHRLIVAQWPAWVRAPLLIFGSWALLWISASIEED